MKNIYIIGIILLTFASCNANFLRDLGGTLTLKSVTLPTYCGTLLPSGYSFSIVLNVPDGASTEETTTEKIVLAEKDTPANTLAASCTIEAKTASGSDEDANVSCTTTAAGTTGTIYVLSTPSEAITEGDITITAWSQQSQETAVNTNYIALGQQTTEQKFDYSQEGTKAFTIKYADDLTEAKKPSVVKAGETEISGCVIDETDNTILSCQITSTTVAVVDNKETSYTIYATDACGTEVNTGITVKVTNSNTFIQLSKIALFVLGIFLF